MKTIEDFMIYFNQIAFMQMNAVYGVNYMPSSSAGIYYDAFVFLRRVYQNIEEFKDDKDADTFVNHILKYLDEWKESTDISLYDATQYAKISNMYIAIESVAKLGGFIQ